MCESRCRCINVWTLTFQPPLSLQEFFKSPATTGKDGLRVVLTPKSKGKTPGASTIGQAQDTAPASAAKSAPRTTGRSRLSQVGGGRSAGSLLQGEGRPCRIVAVASLDALISMCFCHCCCHACRWVPLWLLLPHVPLPARSRTQAWRRLGRSRCQRRCCWLSRLPPRPPPGSSLPAAAAR